MITGGQWKRWKDNSITDDRLNTYVLSDIRQMLGEIERLRGALKPFAGLRIHDAAPDTGLVVVSDLNGGIVDTGTNRVEVRDIRNARRVYGEHLDGERR